MIFLVALFIVVPIVEIYVIIQVGQTIGPWWTVALLIADSIIGWRLMRSQSRQAWVRFNERIAAGRPPAREVFDGALIIFGGALLLTPGFITDIFGFALLLPPSRAVVRRLLVHAVAGRTAAGRAAIFATRRTSGRGGTPPPPPADVERTAHDVDSDPRLTR